MKELLLLAADFVSISVFIIVFLVLSVLEMGMDKVERAVFHTTYCEEIYAKLVVYLAKHWPCLYEVSRKLFNKFVERIESYNH